MTMFNDNVTSQLQSPSSSDMFKKVRLFDYNG
jgi:hypothetical protein